MILFYDLKRGVFKNIFEGVAKAFPSSKLVFAQYDCHKHDPPAPFSGIHHDKVHYPAVYYYRQKHGKWAGSHVLALPSCHNSDAILTKHPTPCPPAPTPTSEPEHYTGLRMQATIIDWIKAHPHIKHAEL